MGNIGLFEIDYSITASMGRAQMRGVNNFVSRLKFPAFRKRPVRVGRFCLFFGRFLHKSRYILVRHYLSRFSLEYRITSSVITMVMGVDERIQPVRGSLLQSRQTRFGSFRELRIDDNKGVRSCQPADGPAPVGEIAYVPSDVGKSTNIVCE